MIHKARGCGNICTQKKSLDNWGCTKLKPTYGDGRTQWQSRWMNDLYYECEPTQWIQRVGLHQRRKWWKQMATPKKYGRNGSQDHITGESDWNVLRDNISKDS